MCSSCLRGTASNWSARFSSNQASDGTNVAERYRAISITNLPPVITSAIPAIITGVGANYQYQIVATDPAGAADPLNYTVVRGPTDMSIGPTGLLQWTPDVLDVTRVDEPLRQGALVLVAATTLILVVCTAVGEKRWRAAGLDIDGKLPADDEKGARR